MVIFVSHFILSLSLALLSNLHLEGEEGKADWAKTKFSSVGEGDTEWKPENTSVLINLILDTILLIVSP